jgi:hypothetical protein
MSRLSLTKFSSMLWKIAKQVVHIYKRCSRASRSNHHSFFFALKHLRTNHVLSTQVFLPRLCPGRTRKSNCDRTRTFVFACSTQLWRRPGCLLHRKLQPRGRNHIELYNMYVLYQHSCTSNAVLILGYRCADSWCVSSPVERILLLYLRRTGE